MKLYRKSKNLLESEVLLEKVEVAKSPQQRARGLIGKSNIAESFGMLFPVTASVHTFGMKFPIDCIYLSRRNGSVVKIVENLVPWRFSLCLSLWVDTLEVAAGWASRNQIQVGDQLYVDN